MEQSFTFNPGGYSFLGFTGSDGLTNIHTAIHFEPVKYLFALILNIYGHIDILYIFIILIYCLPALYLIILTLKGRDEYLTLNFLSFLFVLAIPSGYSLITYDLRPYILLTPLILTILLSLVNMRKPFEILIFFLSLYLIREESLVINLFITVFAFTYFRQQGITQKGSLWIMVTSVVLYLIVLLSYYSWCGYSFEYNLLFFKVKAILFKLKGNTLLIITATFILTLLCLAGMALFKSISKGKRRIWKYLFILVLYLPFIVYLMRYGIDIKTILFGPKWTILFLLIVPIFYMVYQDFGRKRKLFLRLLTILVFVCLVLNLWGLSSDLRKFSKDKIFARKVFQARNFTDRYSTRLVCNNNTMSAFNDYNYLFTYGKYPFADYPLRKVLPTCDYVIISTDNREMMLAFFRETETKYQELELEGQEQNDEYSIYKLERK
jgi:hypothetical protein